VTIYMYVMYVYIHHIHTYTQSYSTGREEVGFTGRGERVVGSEGDYIYVCMYVYTHHIHTYTHSLILLGVKGLVALGVVRGL